MEISETGLSLFLELANGLSSLLDEVKQAAGTKLRRNSAVNGPVYAMKPPAAQMRSGMAFALVLTHSACAKGLDCKVETHISSRA